MGGTFNLFDCVAGTGGLQEVSPSIWSVEYDAIVGQRYDGRAKLYDMLIGSRLYNHIAWGISDSKYTEFASKAVAHGDGPLLDAGCGSLVSTIDAYAACTRPTVLADLSLDMLTVARDRLVQRLGGVPKNILLLQADIRSLPFSNDMFETVLCPGMLHLFPDVTIVTSELARVTHAEGSLFFSALVAERKISSAYLNMLHRSGEVAEPKSFAELVSQISSARSGIHHPPFAELVGSVAFLRGSPREEKR